MEEHVEEEEEEIAKDSVAGSPSGTQPDDSRAGSAVPEAGFAARTQQKDTSGGDKVNRDLRSAKKGNEDPTTGHAARAQSKGSGTYSTADAAVEKRKLQQCVCRGYLGCLVGHGGQRLPEGRLRTDITLPPNGGRRFCGVSMRTVLRTFLGCLVTTQTPTELSEWRRSVRQSTPSSPKYVHYVSRYEPETERLIQ